MGLALGPCLATIPDVLRHLPSRRKSEFTPCRTRRRRIACVLLHVAVATSVDLKTRQKLRKVTFLGQARDPTGTGGGTNLDP